MLKEKIKSIRISNNLTQTEFADKIGVGRSYIAQLESGKTEPSQQLLNKMIDTFDISSGYFEDGQELLGVSENIILADNHPIFKVVQDYQKHYPEIEYHSKKLEDILAMAKKLHAPIVDQVTKVLALLSKNDIKTVYSQILAYLVEVESIKQKGVSSINAIDINTKINQLNLLLVSSLEQTKASHESFYDLLKKWILDDLFVDDVIKTEKEKQIDRTLEFLRKNGVSATRDEALAFFESTSKT